MNTPGIKSGFTLSRNPVILQNGTHESSNNSNGDGTLEIIYAGTNVYEAKFSLPLEMDIADILDSYIEFFKEVPVDNNLPICQIEEPNEFEDRKFTAILKLGDYVSELDRFVIPGGISHQNFRQLSILGKDIFQVRFFNHKSNFFLSTRTASWLIVMKETELYPLYFLPENTGDLISIVERTGGNIYEDDSFDRGVAVLDVVALRRYFAHNHNVLPSVFDVYYNSCYSCRIVVERSDCTRQRYRIKFRNSLGVFEIIELNGELSVTPDYSGAEDAVFKRYDSITGSFHSDRERVQRRQAVTVETGVKRPDEVRFLMDMIGSEEVYLLDLTPTPLKVIPSVENFSYRPRPESPEKFSIKLELSDSEINIMQDIIDGSDGMKPRIFSKQFSIQFN